jgi:hypothetical protein
MGPRQAHRPITGGGSGIRALTDRARHHDRRHSKRHAKSGGRGEHRRTATIFSDALCNAGRSSCPGLIAAA